MHAAKISRMHSNSIHCCVSGIQIICLLPDLTALSFWLPVLSAVPYGVTPGEYRKNHKLVQNDS